MNPLLWAQLGLGAGQGLLGAYQAFTNKGPGFDTFRQNIDRARQGEGLSRQSLNQWQDVARTGLSPEALAKMQQAARQSNAIGNANIANSGLSRFGQQAGLQANAGQYGAALGDIAAKDQAQYLQNLQLRDKAITSEQGALADISDEESKYYNAQAQAAEQRRKAGEGLMSAGLGNVMNTLGGQQAKSDWMDKMNAWKDAYGKMYGGGNNTSGSTNTGTGIIGGGNDFGLGTIGQGINIPESSINPNSTDFSNQFMRNSGNTEGNPYDAPINNWNMYSPTLTPGLNSSQYMGVSGNYDYGQPMNQYFAPTYQAPQSNFNPNQTQNPYNFGLGTGQIPPQNSMSMPQQTDMSQYYNNMGRYGTYKGKNNYQTFEDGGEVESYRHGGEVEPPLLGIPPLQNRDLLGRMSAIPSTLNKSDFPNGINMGIFPPQDLSILLERERERNRPAPAPYFTDEINPLTAATQRPQNEYFNPNDLTKHQIESERNRIESDPYFTDKFNPFVANTLAPESLPQPEHIDPNALTKLQIEREKGFQSSANRPIVESGIDKLPFGQAFAMMRKKYGKDAIFRWKGKDYGLYYAGEKEAKYKNGGRIGDFFFDQMKYEHGGEVEPPNYQEGVTKEQYYSDAEKANEVLAQKYKGIDEKLKQNLYFPTSSNDFAEKKRILDELILNETRMNRDDITEEINNQAKLKKKDWGKGTIDKFGNQIGDELFKTPEGDIINRDLLLHDRALELEYLRDLQPSYKISDYTDPTKLKEGGAVKSRVINIEGGEVLVDSNGKPVRTFTAPMHPALGLNDAGNRNVPVGHFVVPKKDAEFYTGMWNKGNKTQCMQYLKSL